MHYLATLSAFAAAASTVQALGTAYIYNQCTFDTYVWPVDAERNPLTPITIPSGGSYSEPYRTPSSGGVSLKISKTTTPDPITQLEYTVAGYDGTNPVWYDGSNVNCAGTDCPFQAYNLFLTTSEGSACPQRNCTSGAESCPGFYTVYNDDVNSLSCADTADVMLYLCSGETASSSPAPVASSWASAPAYVAPASSPKPTPTASPVQTMEAVVTTMVTVTTSYPKRHVHARHHQPQQ